MGGRIPWWTQRPRVCSGEGWAPSGCSLPVTHHVMKTSNHTIQDQSLPRSTRTVPSAIYQDGGVKYGLIKDSWKRQHHYRHREHKNPKICTETPGTNTRNRQVQMEHPWTLWNEMEELWRNNNRWRTQSFLQWKRGIEFLVQWKRECIEAWDSHKLQIPGLSYNWWGFKAWEALQDSTNESSIDKAETSLDWQEYFSQLQDTTDALPCHIHLYACESWTLTAELQRRIQTMEMRCYHKIRHISYKDHVTNKEVHAKIQQTIGPHEDILTIVKRCKLQWYGHVSCSLGLAKTILQSTVKGKEDKADRERVWKTTSGNGQAWSLACPRGLWRTWKNGEDWLQNCLWCPNDPRR